MVYFRCSYKLQYNNYCVLTDDACRQYLRNRAWEFFCVTGSVKSTTAKISFASDLPSAKRLARNKSVSDRIAVNRPKMRSSSVKGIFVD